MSGHHGDASTGKLALCVSALCVREKTHMYIHSHKHKEMHIMGCTHDNMRRPLADHIYADLLHMCLYPCTYSVHLWSMTKYTIKHAIIYHHYVVLGRYTGHIIASVFYMQNINNYLYK